MSVKEELERLHRQQHRKVHLSHERVATIQRVGDPSEFTAARRAETTAIKQARIVDQLRSQVVEVLANHQIEDTPDTVVDGLHQPVQRALDATAASGIRQAISLERINERFRPLPFPAEDARIEDDVAKELSSSKKVHPGVVSATISRTVYALDKEGKLVQPKTGAVKKTAQDYISSLRMPGFVRIPRISGESIEAAVERTAVLVRSPEIDLKSFHPAEARLILDMRQHNLWGRLSAQDLISVGKRLTVPETIMPSRKEKNPDLGKIKLGGFQLELLVALAEFDPQTGERIYKSPTQIIEQLYEADLALLSSPEEKQDLIRRKIQTVHSTKSILVKKLGAAVASPNKMGQKLQSFFDEVKSHPSRKGWHGPQIVELVKDAFRKPKVEKERVQRVRKEKVAKEPNPDVGKIKLGSLQIEVLNAVTQFDSQSGRRIYISPDIIAQELFATELGQAPTAEDRSALLAKKIAAIHTTKSVVARKIKAAIASPDKMGSAIQEFLTRIKDHPSRVDLSDAAIAELVRKSFARPKVVREKHPRVKKELVPKPVKEKNPDAGKITVGALQLKVLNALTQFDSETGARINKSTTQITEEVFAEDLARLASGEQKQDFIAVKMTAVRGAKVEIVKKLKVAVITPEMRGTVLVAFFDRVKDHPARREMSDEAISEMVRKSLKRSREVKEKQPRVKREKTLRTRSEREPKIAKEKTPKLIDLTKNERLLLNLLTGFNSVTGARIYKTPSEVACMVYAEELGKLVTQEEKNDFIKRAKTRISVAKVFLLNKLGAALETPDLRSDKVRAFFERVKGHPSRALLSDEQIVDLVSCAFRRPETENKTRKSAKVQERTVEDHKEKQSRSISRKRAGQAAEIKPILRIQTETGSNLRGLALFEKAIGEMSGGDKREVVLDQGETVKWAEGLIRVATQKLGTSVRIKVTSENTLIITKYSKRAGRPSQGNLRVWREPTPQRPPKPEPAALEVMREPTTSEKVLIYRPERNGSRDRADIPSEDEMVAFNLLMLSRNGLPAFRDIHSYLLVAHGAEFDLASPHRKFSLISEKERELHYATQRISEAIVRGRELQRRGESLPQHLRGLIDWMSQQKVDGEQIYPDDLESSKLRDFLTRRISIYDLLED